MNWRGIPKRDPVLPPQMHVPAPRLIYGLEREFCIDNLLVRIHCIVEMIWWTGLAPWESEFPFPGSLTSTNHNVYG